MTDHIFIGIPAYGGQITSACTISLWNLGAALEGRHQGRPSHARQRGNSLSRSALASLMVQMQKYSHLLFVDADMHFEPSAVLNLHRANKNVIGAIYPKRSAEPAFVFVPLQRGQVDLDRRGLCRVKSIGMGLCLIRREALTDLIATKKLQPEPRRRLGVKAGNLFGFFDPILTAELSLSEDFAFCERYRTLCNGEIWATTADTIGHVGKATYQRRFIDQLKKHKISAAPSPLRH